MILYYIILYYIVLYCIILYYIILSYNIYIYLMIHLHTYRYNGQTNMGIAHVNSRQNDADAGPTRL